MLVIWWGDVVDSEARCLLLTISHAFSFRTALCIICRKIAPMFAELELTWRDVASGQVGVSSYLVTDSPLRIFISWFFGPYSPLRILIHVFLPLFALLIILSSPTQIVTSHL